MSEAKASSVAVIKPPTSVSPPAATRPVESKSGKLSFESTVQLEDLATYLNAIAQGIEKGNLELSSGDQNLELELAQQVQLSVKAIRKDDKQKISFEVSWRKAGGSDLKISSK